MSCGEPQWWHDLIGREPGRFEKEPMEEIKPIPYSKNPEIEDMMKSLKEAQEKTLKSMALPEHLIDPERTVPNDLTHFSPGVPLGDNSHFTIAGQAGLGDPLLVVDDEGIKWRNEQDKYMNLIEEIQNLRDEMALLKQKSANFQPTSIPEGALAFDTEGNQVMVFDGTDWQPYTITNSFDLTTISLVESDEYPIGETADLKQNPLEDFDRAMKGVL